MSTVPAEGNGPAGNPRLMLAGCCLALFISSLDISIVNVALPAIQAGLHTSVSGLQWVASAYTLVLASGLLLAGATGDRTGRRRMFLTGLTVFAAGSLACSLAPSLGVLIAFRVVQAAGAAMMQPNALSTITSVITDPARRAHAIGVWAAVFGIAVASGPIAGGLLVAAAGWRSVFWASLPVAAVAFVLVTRNAPETRAEQPRRADPAGQALLLVTLAAVTYATIEGPVRGWSAAAVISSYAIAAASLAAFTLVERGRAQPLIELRFFRSPAFSGAAAAAVFAFAILSGFLFLNTLYLQDVLGYSALRAGLAVLPATAVIAAVSPLAATLVARSGSRLPMTAAGLLLTLGTVVLREATAYSWLALGYVLLGAGLGMINPPITNAAVSGMPRAQAGVASAVATSSRQLGNVLGVAVIGSAVVGVTRQAGRVATVSGDQAFRTAFTAASHVGWDIAIGCAVAIVILAWCTTPAPAAPASASPAADGRPAEETPTRRPGRRNGSSQSTVTPRRR